MVPLQIEKVLEDLVREMTIDATKAGVKLEIQPVEPGRPGVLGNGDKLRQVFRNIILNAIQASSAGGQVRISSSVCEEPAMKSKDQNLAAVAPQRHVVVAIEDRGCGIDPTILLKIFDPFFTQKDSGTGLGLSISQKIVDQHGGRIEVKSELGKGTTFSIYLPAA
jgi:signal transduction histidine kinase